jgi:hypothetical protein
MAEPGQARTCAREEYFVSYFPSISVSRGKSTHYFVAVAGGGIRGYLGKNGPGQRVLSASFAVLRHYPRPMPGEVSSKSLWNAKYKWGDDGLYYACEYQSSSIASQT